MSRKQCGQVSPILECRPEGLVERPSQAPALSSDSGEKDSPLFRHCPPLLTEGAQPGRGLPEGRRPRRINVRLSGYPHCPLPSVYLRTHAQTRVRTHTNAAGLSRAVSPRRLCVPWTNTARRVLARQTAADRTPHDGKGIERGRPQERSARLSLSFSPFLPLYLTATGISAPALSGTH